MFEKERKEKEKKMNRFIITADNPTDILGLLTNTREHYKTATWDAKSVQKINVVDVDEDDLDKWLSTGHERFLDDHIMSGEVPVGGMVVVADKDNPPTKGYVCGNGTAWYPIPLTDELKNAVLALC